MFIDKNQRRWNKPYSRGTTEIDGVRYPNTVWDDPAFRAAQGITEIADPVLPEGVTDETHCITRPDLPPYLEWTPKPQEQLDQAHNSKVQQQIDAEERNAMLPRVTREFMLAAFEAQAAAAGVDPMLNVGYKRVKELDDGISAKRRQIIAVPKP